MKPAFSILLCSFILITQAEYLRARSSHKLPSFEDFELFGLDDLFPTDALDTIALAQDAYKGFSEFEDSVSAWKAIDWETGDGIDKAIHRTVKACVNMAKEIGDDESNGLFESAANSVIKKIAETLFPPKVIAAQAGKVLLVLDEHMKDITEDVKGVHDEFVAGHLARALEKTYELVCIVFDAMIS